MELLVLVDFSLIKKRHPEKNIESKINDYRKKSV